MLVDLIAAYDTVCESCIIAGVEVNGSHLQNLMASHREQWDTNDGEEIILLLALHNIVFVLYMFISSICICLSRSCFRANNIDMDFLKMEC